MNDITIKKESNKNKDKAKSLFFMTDYPVAKIAALSGASVDDVKLWAFGTYDHTRDQNCWFYQKEILGVNTTNLTQYREVEPVLIADTKAKTLCILTDQIDKKARNHIGENGEEMHLDDIKKVADIFSQIDKIDRLEQGRATNITESKLDRMDAVEAIGERRNRSDYIDADFTEIE